ncbi:hypothetical protein CR513_21666, partial [Mucuna pruriens]
MSTKYLLARAILTYELEPNWTQIGRDQPQLCESDLKVFTHGELEEKIMKDETNLAYKLIKILKDLLVDYSSNYKLLSFMDVYLVYNQIPMNAKDEIKITFMVNKKVYCDKIMPLSSSM